MRAARNLFADMTAALEDLHSIACEGQRHDCTADEHEVLAITIGTGLAAARDLVLSILIRLGKPAT